MGRGLLKDKRTEREWRENRALTQKKGLFLLTLLIFGGFSDAGEVAVLERRKPGLAQNFGEPEA